MLDPLAEFLGFDKASTPSAPKRLRMPAEWEPMDAVWMSWPTAKGLWADNRHNAEKELAHLIATLCRYAPVNLNCKKQFQPEVSAALRSAQATMERITFHDIPTNDVWCRDHGATFVHDLDKKQLNAVSWTYNGWGGKFPHDLDTDVARNMALSLLIPCISSPLTCEGGALEINSHGVLLTTESVLLNPNRNPDWNRKDIKSELRKQLGASEIVWLKDGLAGDDTDGHIDMLARFFADDGIVTIRRKNSRAPDYRVLEENYEIVSSLRTPHGGRYNIATLPLPDPLTYDDWRYEKVPVSYANFLILNDGVIAPVYGEASADKEAIGLLKELFPHHDVTAVPSRSIIQEGGSIHCLSQQQPRKLSTSHHFETPVRNHI